MADQCLFFHRDYAGRSNDVVPVSMHSQSQRILEVEVGEVQTLSDYNFALPDAGRQVSVKDLQSGLVFLHRQIESGIVNRTTLTSTYSVQDTFTQRSSFNRGQCAGTCLPGRSLLLSPEH